MTGVESRYVDTASLRVHYLHAGEAHNPPVVLLHGFPQTSHMWRHQIAALAERYEVVAPATRGFGRTAKPRIRSRFSSDSMSVDRDLPSVARDPEGTPSR